MSCVMSLQTELQSLGERVASFHESPVVSEEAWQEFTGNTVVALMAGGESSRFSAVLDGKAIHKNAHQLPNGDTMIEMAIRMYRDAGIKKFVALVWHNASSIEEVLGDGSKLGVEIVYSHDPERPAGKGGAVRNALDNGSIPLDANLIVVNPDDVILDFPGSFPRFIGEAHLEGLSNGMQATAVLAPGQAYSSSGMMVTGNRVVDTEMYPFIPVPAHIGTTIFAPIALPRFRELFNLDEKTEFERVLFPLLAQEKKLWAAGLTKGTWLAVNDLKAYKTLVAML
jgi:NDP-sugar pyrophosphorylase family protein